MTETYTKIKKVNADRALLVFSAARAFQQQVKVGRWRPCCFISSQPFVEPPTVNYCSFYCRCVFCLVSSLRGFDVFITSRGSFVKRGEREEQPPGRYPQLYRHTKIRLWEELAAAVWTSHCAALRGNLKAPADSFSELLFFRPSPPRITF